MEHIEVIYNFVITWLCMLWELNYCKVFSSVTELVFLPRRNYIEIHIHVTHKNFQIFFKSQDYCVYSGTCLYDPECHMISNFAKTSSSS